MGYSADTDSSVARHNGATHFMALLNLKGDKMTTVLHNGLKYFLHAGKCQWICNGAKVYDLNLINLLFSKI